MKYKKMIFGIIILFILTGICNISNVSAIENPDYIITLEPGEKVYFEYDFIKGTELKIEFEVISGGNKDVDFYIKNSVGGIVEDWGRVMSGLVYFTAPYDDEFRVYFSNAFSIITTKVIEINLDIVAYGKSITIINPKSNDVFDNGYNYIDWSTTGTINYVRIELWGNYDGYWSFEVITTSTYNDGSYKWYLSSSDIFDGDFYLIKILDYNDNSVYANSDYFTIEIDEDYDDSFTPAGPGISLLAWLLFIILPATAGVVIIVVLVRKHKRKIPEEPIII